jgi:hypothetical protein
MAGVPCPGGQIEAAVARSGKGDLARALSSGETWTVE